jgi:hypothetical protein
MGRMDAESEQTGRSAALVVRVWLEGGPDGFRARLTTGDAGAADAITVAVAATPEAVLDAVRAWLDDFVAPSART